MIFSSITLQSYNLHGKFPNSLLRILYSTLLNHRSALQNDYSSVQNHYSALQNEELNVVRERYISGERKKYPCGKKKVSVEKENSCPMERK